MKKAILLAGLLLIGVACSKNDDSKPAGKEDGKVEKPDDKGKDKDKPTPSPSPAPSPSPSPSPSSPAPSIGENVDPIFPKMKNGDNQNYSLTTYEREQNQNKVKKVIRESYSNNQKENDRTVTTTITYGTGKYPTVVDEVGGFTPRKVEYTYNDRDQITFAKKTESGGVQTKEYHYDDQGRLSKIVANYGGSPQVFEYSYPDSKTVVKKDNSSGLVTTYTFEGENLVKEVSERKENNGQVVYSQTTIYEYDTTIKNPNASLGNRLLNPYFFNEEVYSEKTSKNAVTKKSSSIVDYGHSVPGQTSTYTYEKNAQGYPTKVKEVTSGNAQSTIEYQY